MLGPRSFRELRLVNGSTGDPALFVDDPGRDNAILIDCGKNAALGNDFKVNQRLAKPRSWRRPWSKFSQFGDWLLLDKGCGYGTSPSRAIRAALLIVLGFALIL
jgi:hypothetical protein